ncbi:Hypothetical predicted protein [Cloeon dipterum]|uniref:WD repeat-containing protein 55 homolog n=1 Tax=Cloeon dipterum TaxID=197152 RepID=A0A8S1BXK8_9INSE|nr:Hypothetical predicted protein [Cloeon dipterum]
MFLYLSKKIAIPNNIKLKCLAWNKEQGYIACGGDDGLLKILKLDSAKDGKAKGLAAASNLSMNQTLEGHNGQIQVVAWNEVHQKLTSSDQYGLIIVWMLYKGSWYEEMINNRNKSVVRGMAWSCDGQKICIVYEDGAIIMGSVDGNRIWGKELKGTALAGIEWSPDSQFLLFTLRNGEIHAYDSQGLFMMKLNITAPPEAAVVGMQWYNGKQGYYEPNCPVLAILYSNGHLLLLKDANDDGILIKTNMSATCCQWNHNGSVLAVTGTMTTDDEENPISNMLQLYSPYGEHLRTLRIPGTHVSSCVWEGGSLRLALAVDSYIYFANLRPNYKWGYYSNTVVYSTIKADRPETCITFWDTKNNECYSKYVSRLLGISAAGEHCVLATRSEENTAQSGKYGLILCNTIGTPVDTKFIEIEPLNITMNPTHVIIASKSEFYVWNFRTPKSRSSIEFARMDRKERIYHVDDAPSGAADKIISDNMTSRTTLPIVDPICCIACSDKTILIGRESGLVQRYTLPQVALISRINLATRPYKMAINCDSTRVAVIDVNGVMTFMELEPSSIEGMSDALKGFERRDIWDIKWASDNAELFAIMEKTRMYVFRNLDPEEPILSSGYICSFQDLELKAVLLDEVIQETSPPGPHHLLQLEVKSLRDTRELLSKVGLTEAATFIEDNPHPRLWRLLAEAAVEQLNLQVAETAFVRCRDYPGIQLIKRLQSMNNDILKQAEVAAYFKKFDQAEKLYLDVDRRDLAVALRERLGDWFRVIQLIKMGPGGTDTQIEVAWNCIGDFLADRHKWEAAKEYYEKGNNHEKLVQCYYNLEEYDALESVVNQLPEGHPLLPVIADRLASVGLCEQAVKAYIKCNCIRLAVDTCVELQQWSQAVALAEEHQVEDIDGLLAQYAEYLLNKGDLTQAVELYRKAGCTVEAVKILINLAKSAQAKNSPLLYIKKIYLLAALLVDKYKETRRTGAVNQNARRGVTDPLLGIENPWRGVEAYHYLMLSQRQLYRGFTDAALKTALQLQQYENILDPETVYCVIALASCANKAFGTCSKAFIRLEALEEVSESRRQKYADLAMELFTKFAARDGGGGVSGASGMIECPNCETLVPGVSTSCPSCESPFVTCVATGCSIPDIHRAWTCATCKHSALASEMATRNTCPLCHDHSRRAH